MKEHDHKKASAGKAQGAEEHAHQADPRAAKWNAIVKGATRWNEQHADLVAAFNKSTDGRFAGSQGGISVRNVRQWQIEHGLKPDGKITKEVVTAAGAGAKKKDEADVVVTDEEAAADAKPQGDLAAEAVGAGETAGEEKATEGGDKFEGDSIAADAVQKVGEDIGGEMSGAGKVGVGAAARLALVPHIVSLVRHHDFKGALKVIWESVGNEERAELVKAIVEKIGGELSEHALVWFERAALAGAVVDVLGLGWEWTIAGIKAVQEAHEKGDQKARIRIYAYAWADTILTGEHSAAGAVTAEEREAAQKGKEDGLATRARSPELPFLLMAQYHTHPAAREALELELERKAGL